MTPFAWVAAVAAALLVWSFDASARWQILDTANAYGRTSLPAREEASATGRELGQRTRLQLSADSYHWIMQAQAAQAEGVARLRRADYDNAPHGRELHWSSPLRWWITVLGWFEAARTGQSVGKSIEVAAGYAGPVLLGLLVVALTPWVAARFGRAAAAVFGAGLVCVAPVSSAFAIGAIDHHGLAVVAALVCVLALAAVPGTGAEQARRAARLSGIAGGVGLWTSAATQVPVLVGIGLAALVGSWTGRRYPVAFEPRLWRTWGLAGGFTSLAAYLCEYFPGHLGWRLEVNHPLYALAWAGAGELLFRTVRRIRGEPMAAGPHDRGIAVAALAAVAALPATILFAGKSVFRVADPFLWALHADYIEEFAPLAEEFRRPDGPPGWAVLLLVVNILPVAGLPLLAQCCRRGADPRIRAAGWLVLGPALLALALALAQKRWLHLSGALWLGALVVLVSLGVIAGSDAAGRCARWLRGLLVAAVLLPWPVAVVRQWWVLAHAGPVVGPTELRELAARDVARWLRRRVGGEPAVVLSDATTTTQLIYFGGLRGVGTLYWENLDGLRAAMAAAGAAEADEARKLIQARGITHVVVFSWQPFADEAARLMRGRRMHEALHETGFLQAVQAGRGPAWLRPLPYRLPAHPYFADQYVAVFEVAEDQSAADAAVHQARYLLAHGDETTAIGILGEVRRRAPDHLPALCTLAQVRLARRDAAGLDDVWPQILAAVARGAVVEPDDRVVIIQCLLAAGRREAARAELAAFWRESDERKLRRMPAVALGYARRVSSELAVPPPAPVAGLVDRLLATP